MPSTEDSTMPAANRWLFIGLAVGWLLLVLTSYWAYHPYYSLSISKAINYELLLLMMLMCGGAQAWLQMGKGKRSYNGLMLYGFILLLQGVAVAVYGAKQGLFTGGAVGGAIYFMGFNVLLHAAIFSIVLVMYAGGQWALRTLSPAYARDSHKVLSIALGISFVGLVMFLLGLAGLLYAWLLGGLFLGILAWQRKAVLLFLKEVFIKRLRQREESPLWQIPIYLLLINIAINGIYAIKLMPIGFDGAGLYMNTTHLIAEYNALPQGGQAYNWQLFLSLGELLFGEMTLSIMMAHFSGLLCLWAVFRLARLFVPRQLAWLAAAVFYLSPAVNFHLTLDEKVDLGFLYIGLAALLLLLEYQVRMARSKAPELPPVLLRLGRLGLGAQSLLWILAGWLAGYAFGIKYTGVMAIAALLVYGTYQRAGGRAGMGMLALLVGLLFLSGSHRFGYIELGGALPIAIAGISLLMALPLLLLGFRGKREALRAVFRQSTLFAVAALFAFSPWMGKHAWENKSLRISALIEGQSPEPAVRTSLPEVKQQSPQQGVFPMLEERLAKRGVNLSPEQREKAQAILKAYEPQLQQFQRGQLSAEERERYLKEARRSFEREVLTTQQKVQLGLSVIGGGPGVGESSQLESGKREEVKRYMGYESGAPLFLSMPYDLTMNTNVRYLKYLDLGFLFLLFFPLLLFSWRGTLSLAKNGLLLLLLAVFWGISLVSVYTQGSTLPDAEAVKSSVMEMAAKHQSPFDGLVSGPFLAIQQAFLGLMQPLQGLYAWLSGMSFTLVYALLLALAALSYWLMREQLSRLSPNLKGLLAFALSFGFFWLLLGSGIVWYAFPLFVGLGIVLVYFVHKPERLAPGAAGFTRPFLTVGLGISLLLATVLNFMSTTEAEPEAGMRFQNAFVKYAATSISKRDAQFEFNPIIVELRRIINEEPDSKVYRVGTYFNYYIQQNDRRVYEDNQLGLFENFQSQPGNAQAFLSFLKDNGFRYVLFDLNTASLDETPERSLAKKADDFYRLLTTSPNARLIFTDNLVEAPQDQHSRLGRMRLPGKLALGGQTVYRGSFALFELQ